MRKLLLGLFLLGSLATLANTVDVILPYDTARVISSDYSTGGGKKTIVYLEVLVELKDGTYEMYTSSDISVAGFFGMGRWTIPDRFRYIKDKTGNVRNRIIVKW